MPPMTPVRQQSTAWVRVLCWLTVTLEGFDIVALSAALPTILSTKYLGMGPVQATFVTTISLVGIMVGAIAVGPLSDRVGRRIAIMASVALFSVFTLLVPIAPSATIFGLFRFVAGIGLGACMPAALTTMSEITRSGGRARATTLTMTGYHVGAVLTALLAKTGHSGGDFSPYRPGLNLVTGVAAAGLLLNLAPLLRLKRR